MATSNQRGTQGGEYGRRTVDRSRKGALCYRSGPAVGPGGASQGCGAVAGLLSDRAHRSRDPGRRRYRSVHLRRSPAHPGACAEIRGRLGQGGVPDHRGFDHRESGSPAPVHSGRRAGRDAPVPRDPEGTHPYAGAGRWLAQPGERERGHAQRVRPLRQRASGTDTLRGHRLGVLPGKY